MSVYDKEISKYMKIKIRHPSIVSVYFNYRFWLRTVKGRKRKTDTLDKVRVRINIKDLSPAKAKNNC